MALRPIPEYPPLLDERTRSVIAWAMAKVALDALRAARLDMLVDMMDNALFEAAGDGLTRWETEILATLTDPVLIRVPASDQHAVRQAIARARVLRQADDALVSEHSEG